MQIISLNTDYGMYIDVLIEYVEKQSVTTDIFCLQEVDNATKRKLDKLLRKTYSCHYETKYDGQEKFLLATYIKKDLVLLRAEPLLQKHTGTGFAVNYHIQNQQGQTVSVTNVHGFPRPGTKLDTVKRIEQSMVITEVQKRIPNIAARVVVGDFNLLPDTHSIRIFADCGFANLIENCGIATTRNEVVWARFPESKQLFSDYVFVKGLERDEYDLRTDNDIISDHLPMILTINYEGSKYFNAQTKFVSNSGNSSVSQVVNAEN